MRLTLRTLLAYLDDILEPSEARLIGAKIAESGMAQDLVGRLRDVTRRRRLLAPDVDGPGMGVDPNIIAEYLDNALSPEDVADIERVCLESDMHLAEVAGSHQILTLVLGEPVSVVPRSRERMYALGPIARKPSGFASPGFAAAFDPKFNAAEPASTNGRAEAPGATAAQASSKSVASPDGKRVVPSVAAPSTAAATSPPVSPPAGRHASATPTATPRPDNVPDQPPHPKSAATIAGLGAVAARAPDGTKPAGTHPAGTKPAAAPVAPVPTDGAPRGGSTSVSAVSGGDVSGPFSVSVDRAESRAPDTTQAEWNWRRSVPWIVVASLALVFGALLATDPAFRQTWRGPQTSGPTSSPEGDVAMGTDASVENPGGSSDVAGGKRTPKPGDSDTPAQSPEGAVGRIPASGSEIASAKPEKKGAAGSIDPPPPPEPGDAKPADAKPAKKTEPDGDQVATAKPSSPPAAGKVAGEPETAPGKVGEKPNPVAEPPAAKPAPAGGPKLDYVSTEGVLLRYDTEQKDWTPLPRRSVLQGGVAVAAPEPFDSVISINKGRLIATIVGGSVVQFLEIEPPADVGFGTRQGRVLLQTRASTGEAAKAEPADPVKPNPAVKNTTVMFAAGKDRWTLTIADDSLCAVEITPREPDTVDQDFAGDGWTGRIAVVSGTARVVSSEGRGFDLGARSSLAIHPSKLMPADLAVVAGADMPRWIDLGAQRVVSRRNMTKFEEEFEMGRGVTQFLPTVVGSQTAQISELAAKALGLTGNPAALVRALGTSIHKEARIAAIVGLRQWLGESPKHGESLLAECERSFPAGDDRIIYELLWGFSQDDARDPVKSLELVKGLEHDQLAIRELAYFHLKRLTNLTIPFDAQMLPNQRTSVANRFRTHLKKDGGALLKAAP